MKLKLTKATKLKTALERSIDKDNQIIEDKNSIIEGNSREVDIDEIEKLKDIKSEFLISLNLLIQEANLKKGKGEKYSNAYYIKKLSELQRELSHLMKIPTKDGVQIENKQKIKYESVLKFSDITERTKQIEKEIEVIKTKLSKFNETNEISVTYDPILTETIESVGIEL
jgi:hypothetical protein